jgi:hypothetical protein
MIHAARSTDFHGHVALDRQAADPEAAARPGLLTRLFNAMFESREQEADRAVEAYLARTGHRFTDSIEREISDRLLRGGWNLRR